MVWKWRKEQQHGRDNEIAAKQVCFCNWRCVAAISRYIHGLRKIAGGLISSERRWGRVPGGTVLADQTCRVSITLQACHR